uniref:C-type lectin domain-containing protein n=1 Tax=Knipowitschia caucasica TaxID=637954 RepID=A0AAV2LCR5_KNICA
MWRLNLSVFVRRSRSSAECGSCLTRDVPQRGIQEGSQCTKCKNEWALKTSIALLYVLCMLLTIAVAVLGYKVVQRVDSVSEGIENYEEKIIAVETDLKKLDDQTGEKSENTSTEIQAFRNSIWSLQRQLSQVQQNLHSEQSQLTELQSTSEQLQQDQGSLRGSVDSNSASVRWVNGSVQTYSSIMDGLQSDTERLQTELQQQSRLQNQAVLSIGSLNISQAQQRDLISALQRSVEDTSQAIHKMRSDFQTLEQMTRQTRSDTDWLRSKVENLQVVATNASTQAKANQDGLEEVNSQLSYMSILLQNTSSKTEAQDQALRELQDQHRDFGNLTVQKFERLETKVALSEQSMDQVTGNISFTTQLLGSINLNLNQLRSCSESVSQHTELLLSLNNSVADVRADSGTLRSQQEELVARLDKEVTSLSIVMEEMKLVDSKHSQLITNFTILQGPPGPRGPRGEKGGTGLSGQPGQKEESRVSQVLQVYQGQRDFQVFPESQDPKVLGGQGAEQALQAQKVSQGLLVCLGEMDSLVLRVLRGPQALEGPLDFLVSRVLEAYQDHPVSQQDEAVAPSLSAPGCPDEWVNHKSKCYFFSKDFHTFDDAKLSCELKSASLLIIRDTEEHKWLKNEIYGKGYFWMGLTDRGEESVWQWLDGTEPSFTSWKPGQPDNWGHGHEVGEDCAGLIHDALWNDFFCEDLISYICERDIETSTSSGR